MRSPTRRHPASGHFGDVGPGTMSDMGRAHRSYILAELRTARAAALGDAERGFVHICLALERIGTILCRKVENLYSYTDTLCALCDVRLENGSLEKHPSTGGLRRLLDHLRRGRNDALHHGAYARHLTHRAIEVALLIEEAVMAASVQVSDFMVSNPICAEMWQPLSIIRFAMLSNSFSYLPVKGDDDTWYMLSDLAIAQALTAPTNGERQRRMAMTLKEACTGDHVQLLPARVTASDAPRSALMQDWDGHPVIVADENGNLLGIVTPFDVL